MPEDKQPDCVNATGHTFTNDYQNEDGTYTVHCRDCNLVVDDSKPHG